MKTWLTEAPVTKVLLCDPRKNALLKSVAKNGRIDARTGPIFSAAGCSDRCIKDSAACEL